jgi:RNA polymerase sigma-70 factor (ECF subfamily)
MARTPEQIYDEWLVLRCQSGEAEAVSELLRRWGGRLLQRARRLVWDEADACGAAQETMVVVARSIRRLEDPALFEAWARRILAHKCADMVRRRGRERRLVAGVARAAGDGAGSGSEDGDDARRVRRAIDQLPMDSRALLVMRYARDMGPGEIGVALGVAEGTVKSRLHKARRELEQILGRRSS